MVAKGRGEVIIYDVIYYHGNVAWLNITETQPVLFITQLTSHFHNCDNQARPCTSLLIKLDPVRSRLATPQVNSLLDLFWIRDIMAI